MDVAETVGQCISPYLPIILSQAALVGKCGLRYPIGVMPSFPCQLGNHPAASCHNIRESSGHSASTCQVHLASSLSKFTWQVHLVSSLGEFTW